MSPRRNTDSEHSGLEEDILDDFEEIKKISKVNFTTAETDILLELVNKRRAVLESRKTDFGTINKKQAEWGLLTDEFNSDPHTSRRTTKQLKTRWENVKLRAKKDIGTYKREVRKTGGGPGPKPVSNTSERVASIIPNQMDGLTNYYDSDATDKATATTAEVSDLTSLNEELKADRVPSIEPVAKKQKKDPRNALVDWEYEEHKMRLKTLAITYEVEIQRLEKAKLEVEACREEYLLRAQLLRDQIAQMAGSSIVLATENINN